MTNPRDYFRLTLTEKGLELKGIISTQERLDELLRALRSTKGVLAFRQDKAHLPPNG